MSIDLGSVLVWRDYHTGHVIIAERGGDGFAFTTDEARFIVSLCDAALADDDSETGRVMTELLDAAQDIDDAGVDDAD